MQKIYKTEEQVPEKRRNYLCKFIDKSTKENNLIWIVRSFDPEKNKWEKDEVPIAWTTYPPDRDDLRFG